MRGDLFETCVGEDGEDACPPPTPFVPQPPPLPPSTDLADSDGAQQDVTIYKDLVIVGNGPSAICLSYMLAGNWPYYGDAVHPIDFLHYRLDSIRSQSLLQQDLLCLCEGLEGRSNNPVSVLFDTLNHVDADLGVDAPSFLRWVRQPPGHEIDHIALGRALPGGSWQSMDQSSMTLSLSNWMELPNLSYKEFEQERLRSRNLSSGGKESRALVADVAQYYREYVKVQLLEKYFRNHTVVTSVRRTEEVHRYWEVCGHSTWNQESFRYLTPSVVLATGVSDMPKRLRVPGEDLPFVLHSSSELEYLIAERRLGPHSDPLMVIGAGLTAADAIISACFFGVPVVHVFRRAVDDPSLIFRKLHENMYPEYQKVYQMMMGSGNGYRGYRSYPQHQVLDMLPGCKVRLEGPNVSLVLKVSHVLVLIGSRPNLTFLGPDAGSHLASDASRPVDSKQNTMVVDAFSHESVSEKGLFALGPLVGDNFVRFLQGGALAVANHLHRMKMAGSSSPNEEFVRIDEENFDSRTDSSELCQLKVSAFNGGWSPSKPDSDETGEGAEGDGLLKTMSLSSPSSSSEELEGNLLRRWRLKVQGNHRQQRKRRFSHPVCDL